MEAPARVRSLRTFDANEWERYTTISPLHLHPDARLVAWQIRAREHAEEAAALMDELVQRRRHDSDPAIVTAISDGVTIHLAACTLCEGVARRIEAEIDRQAQHHHAGAGRDWHHAAS